MSPVWFTNRFASIAFVLIALASASPANSADTNDFVGKLHTLKTGQTTQSQAVRLLGEPEKRQTTRDGGAVLLTYEQNSSAADDNGIGTITTIAGMASWLMPVQMGMVTQEVAGVVGAGNSLLSSGSSSAPSGSYAVAVLFDREGRFVSWAGMADGAKVSSFALGRIPKITHPGETATTPPSVADGKAHIGALGNMLSELKGSAAKSDLDAGGITGFSVYRTLPGSAGERAGLRAGDIVYMIDGTLLVSREDLARVMNRHRAGDTVWLCVLKINDQSNYWTAQDVKMSF